MTEAQRAERWMTVAVVLAAFLALFSVVVGVVNYDHLRADDRARAHDRTEQIAQAKAQSDAQIAQAKKEAAEQTAVAKAEVQTQLCELIAVLQPSPVGKALAAKEGCTPLGTPSSTAPAPNATGSAAGPARASSSVAGAGPALPKPSPTPRPTSSPHPTPTPSPKPVACILEPLIPLGGC